MKSGDIETRHIMLACAPDRETAVSDALRFTQHNKLVHYDNVYVDTVFSAEQPEFWSMMEEGTGRNRETSEKLLTELVQEGYTSILDLAALPQGYLSKLLHTVAHLQDGFFGIDSGLYNLAEDSHQISARLRGDMAHNPGIYWAVEVRCVYFHHEDAFDALKKKLIS